MWGWWLELHRTRDTAMRVGPILYREIEAWSRMTGARATPGEVEAIVAIDKAFLDWQRDQEPATGGKTAPPPASPITADAFDIMFG